MDMSERELIIAVTEGDIAAVSDLLEQNIDPNFTTSSIEEGFTSLVHVAVMNNFTEVLELLLERGADVNKQNENGETPIFFALYEDIDDTVLELLLKYGADVNHLNKAGHNMLQKVFDDFRNIEETVGFSKVKIVLDNIGDNALKSLNSHKQTFLHFIESIHEDGSEEEALLENSIHDCVEFVEILVKKGLSVNVKDTFGLTPLHTAVLVCCYEAIDCLFKHGAVVQEDNYHPLLHYLQPDFSGFERTLSLLLSKGCDINKTDSSGKTTLHALIKKRSTSIKYLDTLLLNGANLQLQDKFGNTVLHECVTTVFDDENSSDENDKDALECQCIETICYLIEKGVDVNARNNDGLTALHIAVETRGVKVVETLLSLGACVNVTTKTGESVIHRATKVTQSLQAILDKCIETDVKINQGDFSDSSPLHWAVWFQNVSSFAVLLQYGTDLDVIDEKGRTPVDLIYFLGSEKLYSEIGITGTSTGISIRTTNTEHNYSLSIPQNATDIQQSDSEEETRDNTNDRCWEELPNSSCSSMDKDNIFGGCPIISEILHDDEYSVSLDNWRSHLLEHKESLKSFAKVILHSTEMGLYHKTVDNKTLPNDIDQLLRTFTEMLAVKYPLFDCQLVLAGSRNEKTKAGLPDEFDYILRLTKFCDAFEPERSKDFPIGFVRMHLRSGVEADPFRIFIDSSGYLDGMQVLKVLYTEINRYLLESKTSTGKRLFLVKLLEPDKGSLDNLVFRWSGATYKNIEVSVDIVPSLTLSNCYLKNVKEHKLLKAIRIKPLQSVVLKTPSANYVKDWNTYFRLSNAEIEASIINGVPSSVRKGYIFLKTLKDSPYFPHVIDNSTDDKITVNYISTYMLKTAFLNELENDIILNPNLPFVQQDKSDYVSILWAHKIVNHLIECIEKDDMPVPFNDQVNLLLDESGRKIVNKEIYKAQCLCLSHLIDMVIEDP